MRLTGSVAVLNCSDIEQSLNFYEQALQFVVLNKRIGEFGLEWVHLRSGEVVLMLERASARDQMVSNSLNRLYFYSDDVAATHHYLRAKGYDVSPIIETAYMKEFDLHDPDGQRLTLGQRIAK